jgi:ATP-dependent DNA helicase RecG
MVVNGNVGNITTEQRNWIVEYEEGQFGDVKAIDIQPGKMSETVSAFANADGGELWIGIDEDEKKRRSWRGFKIKEDANAHIEILDKVMQLGQSYSFDFLSHETSGGLVLHIEIGKIPSRIIYATSGFAYVRRNAHNQVVDTDEMKRQLERNKGIISFEATPINTNPNIIINSITTRTFMNNVVPSAKAEEWLRKQQIIIDEKPTVAGVILFADEPQNVMPERSGIKIVRYTTSEPSNGTRETLLGEPKSIEGCAYKLIQSTVRETQEIIEGVRKWTEQGAEMVSYPPETLHEIITNAVLHRDYGIANDISVRIFDNRVEVESPGLLPGHITEHNILKERYARNPKIQYIIHKFPNPPNKDIGEGLRTAFEAMKRMRLRPPEIRQKEQSVIVYIRHTRLEAPADMVMTYLKGHPQITNSEGRELTGIRSENTMKEVFVRLAKKNQIERVPNTQGRNSAWQLKLDDKSKQIPTEPDIKSIQPKLPLTYR